MRLTDRESCFAARRERINVLSTEPTFISFNNQFVWCSCPNVHFSLRNICGGWRESGEESIKMYSSLQIERWAREEKKRPMPSWKPQTCFVMPLPGNQGKSHAMSLYVVSFKHFVKCIIWDVSENNLVLWRDPFPQCNKSSKTWCIKHFCMSSCHYVILLWIHNQHPLLRIKDWGHFKEQIVLWLGEATFFILICMQLIIGDIIEPLTLCLAVFDVLLMYSHLILTTERWNK